MGRAMHRSGSFVMLLVLAACGVAAEPARIAGESSRTARLFDEADGLERQRRWNDAVGLYLRLLDDAGDGLVPDDGGPDRLVPARRLVDRRILSRAELLVLYRNRVEARAKRLLEQGERGRDAALLTRVVRDYFCSRSAGAAIHLLGDLACERGEFDAARRYWRLLMPSDSPGELSYPDPAGGPALARAKLVLARLLAGQTSEAVAELNAFRARYSDTAGHLAGRDGNLAAILESQLDAVGAVRVWPVDRGDARAVSYAGDVGRNGVLRHPLPPFAARQRYDPLPLFGGRRRTIASSGETRLACHPVISQGHLFVADARRILAYDLASGSLAGRFDLFDRGEDLPAWAMSDLPANAGGRFTLTVDGDRVFGRLGPPYMRPDRGESASMLVCLRWRAGQQSENGLRQIWTLPAGKPGTDTAAAWEGAPVVSDGRVFAAITRIDGARAVIAVASYREDDPSQGPLWQRDVYEAAAETADRMRPYLLTLAGPTLVYCSHAGVIVGLDAASGRREWAVRYPIRDTGEPSDPSPAVADGDRVYVAPADSDRLFCFNAATGARVWASERLVVAHLLGVSGERVVCQLGGFHAGLCALDAESGRRLPDWGYHVAGADALAPFGRGLLCRDRVYWPTRAAGVHELRFDGTMAYGSTALRELPAGNLAYGDGYLTAAAADRLHVVGPDFDNNLESR
jgi:outer membrane protein assembly factor BamB